MHSVPDLHALQEHFASPDVTDLCHAVAVQLDLPAAMDGPLFRLLSRAEYRQWPQLEALFLGLQASSKKRRIFDILACRLGAKEITEADLLPAIQSAAILDQGLSNCCNTPERKACFEAFACASWCFAHSRARKYAISFSEFEDNFTSSFDDTQAFENMYFEFQGLAGRKRCASAALLGSFCNPMVLGQILHGRVFQLWRTTSTGSSAETADGLEFADWVWLSLAMEQGGAGLSGKEWMRALDVDMDNEVSVADAEVLLRCKADKLCADDCCLERANCRRKNYDPVQTGARVAQIRMRSYVQKVALRADLLAGLQARDPKLLFEILVTMRKTVPWRGYI
jgi:hypothetical protein